MDGEAMFSDDMTLAEARARLVELIAEGVRCPVCDQHAQSYRWSLYASAVRLLVRLWWAGGTTEFIESKTVKMPGQGGDVSRLRHWGLVEQAPQRPDGGKSGWWRVTQLGEDFVLDKERLPKYVYVFDGECLATNGQLVGIKDALGKNFNYVEMLAGLM